MLRLVEFKVILMAAVVMGAYDGCVRAQIPAQDAQVLNWESVTAEKPLRVELILPDVPGHHASPLPTVVYLKHLNMERVGRDSDEQILGRLRAEGCLLIIVDYAHDPAAISPGINQDLLKLRRDLADSKARTLFLEQPIDGNRLVIIPEGFPLRRDIEFARDGERVLGMDVIYPSNPLRPVAAVMEITCDNVNRMSSFSLLFCRDTLIEGAAFAGFASAMVDHPVAPPYKGLDDPMPASLLRAVNAVEKLRSLKDELPLTGKIAAVGFSRGGPFSAMLAGLGEVDAALIHGNRYDYLDLLPDDPMLPRFEKAWGPLHGNGSRWREHGAMAYLTDRASPMFLNTSDTESAEYRDGLAKFAKWLDVKEIEHVYREDRDGRGHTVTLDPARLREIYEFLRSHLISK